MNEMKNNYYITNGTPSLLLYLLKANSKFFRNEPNGEYSQSPLRVLDLCSSPGGKSLFLLNHFVEKLQNYQTEELSTCTNTKQKLFLDLTCNDISNTKTKRIYSNLKKYGFNVQSTSDNKFTNTNQDQDKDQNRYKNKN